MHAKLNDEGCSDERGRKKLVDSRQRIPLDRIRGPQISLSARQRCASTRELCPTAFADQRRIKVCYLAIFVSNRLRLIFGSRFLRREVQLAFFEHLFQLSIHAPYTVFSVKKAVLSDVTSGLYHHQYWRQMLRCEDLSTDKHVQSKCSAAPAV